MKTKLVRPVLVEIKERSHLTLNGNELLWTKYDGESTQAFVNQQLILISLEDEKIEAGDKYYDEHNQLILTATTQSDHNVYNYKKVIAAQSQLSPEYIQQFIEEYNKGGMKDFKIEMEDRFGYCAKCNAYQFASFITCNYRPSCGGKIIQKDEPKLTNGYITIVNTMKAEEKLQQAAEIYQHGKCYVDKGIATECIDCFTAGAKSLESLEYWKEKEKLYSEEEVKEYAEKFAHFIQLENRPEGILTGWHQWFNQHKKH